ncbi:hypothetical protein JTE90_024842 [Oedothorax gibbosus]|uniref:Alpha-latrotoxin n=1 Tax=Oedothorax gibbosus TaxID=931172 RepID=A0AAV6U8R9_9ARAC|nr:hypothetical protein JTE90_024842 [Oedothorax gibbosus]
MAFLYSVDDQFNLEDGIDPTLLKEPDSQVRHYRRYNGSKDLLEAGADDEDLLCSDERSPLCVLLHSPKCTEAKVKAMIRHGVLGRSCIAHKDIFCCYMSSPNRIDKDIFCLILLRLHGVRSFPNQAMCVLLSHSSCESSLVDMLLSVGCRFDKCIVHESSFHCYLDESVHDPKRELKEDILQVLAKNFTRDFIRILYGLDPSPLCLLLRHPKCSSNLVKLLLQFEAVIECHQHVTALHCYLDRSDLRERIDVNPDILRRLLETGLDVNHPNSRRRTPLCMMLHYFNCSAEALKIMLAAGADIYNCYAHLSLLFCYIANNNIEKKSLKVILEHYPTINLVNFSGETPLHRALKFSKYEVDAMKLFLDHPDTHIHPVTHNGSTYLQCALENPHVKYEVIEELIKKGVNVNSINYRYMTALHSAVGNPHCSLEMIELLLDSGASLEVTDAGRTPLEMALMKKPNPNLVRLLLDAGAPLYINNRSVLELAFKIFYCRPCKRNFDCLLLVTKFGVALKGSNFLNTLTTICDLKHLNWYPYFKHHLLMYVMLCLKQARKMCDLYLKPNLTLSRLVSADRRDTTRVCDVDILKFLAKNYLSLSLYLDVISMKVDRKAVCDSLSRLRVCAVSPVEKEVFLNGDILCYLSSFVPTEDLLSFFVAYYEAV